MTTSTTQCSVYARVLLRGDEFAHMPFEPIDELVQPLRHLDTGGRQLVLHSRRHLRKLPAYEQAVARTSRGFGGARVVGRWSRDLPARLGAAAEGRESADVARAIVRLANLPAGMRPLRRTQAGLLGAMSLTDLLPKGAAVRSWLAPRELKPRKLAAAAAAV